MTLSSSSTPGRAPSTWAVIYANDERAATLGGRPRHKQAASLTHDPGRHGGGPESRLLRWIRAIGFTPCAKNASGQQRRQPKQRLTARTFPQCEPLIKLR